MAGTAARPPVECMEEVGWTAARLWPPHRQAQRRLMQEEELLPLQQSGLKNRASEAGNIVASSGPREAGSPVDSPRPKTIYLFL